MPSTSAIASEMKSHGFLPYCRPGARIASFGSVTDAATADSSRALKSNPLIASTQIVMTMAPPMSRNALTICTHVVPFMPPMSTYTIISTPTTATTTDWPICSWMPRSSDTRPPAPAICASR